MEKIVVNTSQIKKQISEIKIQQNYYSNKQNVFVGSKYQANSKLVTFLSKINNNYVNITNNLRQIINYLEDYIHDVEGLERKFSHNGGSIEVSQVSSIANRYYDVIDNFEFNETPYFKLSLFQSVSSDIKNFFSKNQKVEVQSFVVEDDVYNEVLDMYEEQFDLNMEYYEGQIAALKKEIDKYAEIENAKTMLKYAQQNGVPTSETGSLNNPITCQQNLEAALAKFGFSSVEEYDAFIEKLNNGINVSNEYIRQLELSKKMGKYDCLLLVKDFESFRYENHADAKEIDRIAQGSESESLRFDYNEYVSVYPEVSIMDYVATLSEMYNEENIKFYATPEVYQAYELYQASLVTQETGDSEILLGMNLTNAYNYMFEKYGVEEANKYLSTVEDRVNQILGEQDAIERISYLSSEEDVVSILKNEVYTTSGGLGDGVANWGESIGHAFDAIATVLGGKEADRTMSRNEYAQQYFINALASGEYTGPFLMENYEISQGIGYMVPSILVSKGMGALGASATVASTGGSVAMGVSSFGGSYHSSLVEGYSENQALAYGAISGVSEAAFEKFLGGIVSDVAVVDGKSFLQSIAKEATEEGLQNIVDLQVRSALFDESYTIEEYIKSTAKSAIYGGITAGILNSPSAIANGIKVSKVNTAVNNGSLNMEEIVTNLRNSGLDIDFNGKTDSQIISENADIVYDIYQSALKENKIDDNLSVDSFPVSVEAQIEEANYHVQKGDLLHKTIETDSIKNITPELLSKIDDPSAISFKIGNQNYSYLDVKQMTGMVDMSSSSSPLTINQKIEQANLYTSKGNFSTIDASLSDFTLDNLATVQNPDSFYARLEDGNVYSFYQIVDALVDESHHWIDREHGFQVNKSDLDDFYRYKLESGFFSEEQITNMLNNLNSKGYISEELGSYIVSLFQDNQSDIYVKTISTNDMQSIHEKGIYCNGNITSGANNLGNLNLEHTVTKVNSVYDLISILKNANGFSQGMNPIDGAVILKVPKNADIADITYTFSNEVGDTVTAINPMYIQKFVSTDVNHVVSEADVKVQSDVSLNLDDVVTAKVVRDIDEIVNLNDSTVETLSDENSNVEVLKIPRDNIQYGDNFIKKIFAPKLSKKVIENLNNVVYWMDQKYGDNAGITALKQLYNTGDSVCITRDYGCRDYIETLSRNELKMYLDYVARNNFTSNKYSSVESMLRYFEHISPSYEQYGTDQAVIEELCYYELNGRKYSYGEARKIINTALKNNSFVPKFKKVANQEYVRLKTKLINMGFDNYDASIILSSINDFGACSYASLCNNIFYQFRNSPDYFEQIFGYPMFIQKNGNQVLNSAELLLDLYLYANSIENNGNLISIKMKKVMANALSDICDVFGRHILDAEKQIFMHTGQGRAKEVIDAFLKLKDSHLQYGSMQLFNNQYGSRLDYNHFMNMLVELEKYIQLGCDVSMGYFYIPGSVHANTVIHMISCAPHLYDDMSTDCWNEGGGHSVAVTGYNDEGFYVSSWGRKYLIPFRDLMNGGNFEIDVSDIRYNEN